VVTDGLLGASRVLVALAARSLGQLDADVTLVQYRALVVLASRGPQRTIDLATEMEVAPSTVTRMCDRLVRKDLVRRYRRVEDRRATWVGLTEMGRDLVGEVMRSRRRAISQLVRSVTVAGPGRGSGDVRVRRRGAAGVAVVAALASVGDATTRHSDRLTRQLLSGRPPNFPLSRIRSPGRCGLWVRSGACCGTSR
jgi:DNA-binding MarR family transcriptional regulator